MQPLSAFRTIEIPVELENGAIQEVRVPFTVELLFRAEETIQKAAQRKWWRLKPKEESIVLAFVEFCQAYMPAGFDYSRVDPTFPALFFSRVRDELNRSIDNCMNSMTSTPAPSEPTVVKVKTEEE